MKNRIRINIFIFMLLCVANSYAQVKPAADKGILKYIWTAMNFNKTMPQEKVYLHFDNTGYFENETMWFKAYINRTDDGKATDLSKVLYVELLNPSGDVVKTKKLHIDENGQTHGEIKLDTLFGSGYYEVRAYTRYMTNWGTNAVFSRVFPVFKAPKEEGNYSNPTIRTMLHRFRDPNNREDDDSLYTAAIQEGIYTNDLANNVSVKFYPEGGDMIAGMMNKVAVWAVDDNGYPYEMIGQVVDENDEMLTVVKTDSTGKGLFEIIPSTGKLTLITTNKKNKVRKFELPSAKEEGCQLTLDAISDAMSAEIRCTDNLCGQTIGYVIMNSGNVVNCDTMTAVPVLKLNMDRTSLREGVNQLTLFDRQGKILAERMFFIHPSISEEEQITFTTKSDRLKPCGKVELDVQTLPNSTFSFSAIDAATMNNGKQGNIKTWMLLSSELKGYIHNVDYYFESDDEEHRKAADMLMLTQGWRRYDWKLMSGQEKLENAQIIEDKFYLFGKLREYRKRNQVGGVKLNAYLYNQNGQSLDGETVADAEGNYAFELPFLNGEWKTQIFTHKETKNNNMKLKTYYVAIDRQFSPSPRYITPLESSIMQPNKPNLFVRNPNQPLEEEEEFVPITRRDHVLTNVTVKAKRRYFTNDDFQYRNESWARKDAAIFYDIDRELDNIRDRGEEEPTLFEFLAKRNRMFNNPDCIDLPQYDQLINPAYTPKDSANSSNPEYIWRGHMSYNNLPIMWIVDNGMTHNQGAYTDNTKAYGDEFFPIWLEEIKSVYIVPNTSRTIEADLTITDRPLVRIYIFLHHKFSTESQKGIRHTYYQGFNVPETFKMEDYSNIPPMEDFRRTLYWNPDVKTDAQGKAKLQFFNNSSCQEMYISAEGMSGDGKTITNR